MRAVVLVLLCLGAVGCLMELKNWALSTEGSPTKGTAIVANTVEEGNNLILQKLVNVDYILSPVVYPNL